MMAGKMAQPSNMDDLIPTRQSLLSRLRDADDHVSWQDFFQTYWRLIYSVALRSGLSDTEAQEVVQETVIAVSKHMPEFHYDRAKGSFKSWLLTTTSWRIKDQFRKRQREDRLRSNHAGDSTGTAAIDRVPDPGPTMDKVWEDEWQRNLVDTALDRIRPKVNPKQYQMFDLYVVKKWPMTKIVSTLGVNMGQVYLAKHRITALIRKEVKTLEEKF